jgi:hypothetical protein
MTTAEQLEQWRGRAVVDADGDDIGKLDDVYYASDGNPVLARVRSGLMGRHHAVVPLEGSSVSRDYLRIAYRRDQIEQAGRGGDAGEYIDSAEATALAQSYGIALPGSELGYETSANLRARQAEAEAAQQRAAALDQQAQGLQGDAASARAKAERADANAAQVEQDAAAASRAAEEARRQAEAAAADVPPTP